MERVARNPRVAIQVAEFRDRSLRWRVRWATRQAGNFLPGVVFRHPDIVSGLKIEPELRAALEPMAEAKRGISGDRPLALDDLSNAVRRHRNLARQLGRTHTQLVQLFGKDLAWVNGRARHAGSFLNGNPQSRRLTDLLAPEAIQNKSATVD
jgi:hypothetical protein